MEEVVKEQNNKEINLDEYELQEQAVAEAETQEQKPEVKIDPTVLAQVVANLTSMDLPPDLKEQYIQQYTSFVPPILQLVGFDQAIGIYSFQSIPPWLSLILGFVVIAGGVIILKPKPKVEEKVIQPPKPIEKPEQLGAGA